MLHHVLAAAATLAGMVAASPVSSQAAGAGWQFEISSDGSEPTARHEAAYVEAGGKFYLMGGRGGRPVDVYDPVAKTWTDLGNPPLSMHHFQPVVFDGRIWVICAFQGPYPNETPVADIWIYDPDSNAWEMGPVIPAGRNRGSTGAVVHDGRIYIVGGNTMGHDGGYVPWFDCYDPVTDTWTPLPDAPHARDHFTAALVGNKLIVAAGRQTEQPNAFVNTLAAVDVYDFSTRLWSSMPEPIPTERAGTMTVARGEHVIVIGGESTAGAHAEAEALDVGTGEWVTLPPLIDSRHSGGAVIWQDHVYVASGAGDAGGFPELSTQERLDLTGLLGPSPSNLLPNAEFDDGLTGWEDQGDLALNAAGSIATPSLDVENGWAGNTVPVDELETYVLTGVHQVLGTTGDVTIAMEYLDGASTMIGEAVLAGAPTSGWLSFSLEGTTPVGTQSVRVRLEAGGDRVLRVDDLVLVDKRAELPLLGVPANPWALGFSSNGPVAGEVYDPAIDHSAFLPNATLDVFIFGILPTNLPSGPGTLLIDPSIAFFFYVAPGAPFLLPIPVDPTLYGIPLLLQGASVAPGAKRLTNAIEFTIQAP